MAGVIVSQRLSKKLHPALAVGGLLCLGLAFEIGVQPFEGVERTVDADDALGQPLALVETHLPVLDPFEPLDSLAPEVPLCLFHPVTLARRHRLAAFDLEDELLQIHLLALDRDGLGNLRPDRRGLSLDAFEELFALELSHGLSLCAVSLRSFAASPSAYGSSISCSPPVPYTPGAGIGPDDPEEITLNAADRAGPPERQPLGEAVQKKNRGEADCGVDNVVADEQRHRQAVGIVEEVGNDARPPVAGDHAVVQPLGRKRKHRNVGVKKALVTENPNGTRTLTTVESSTLIGSPLAAAVKNPAWPETERS